ncbi:MAG: hypothetical protein AAF999_14785 [Pseudomonadota bacterium]
MKERVPDGTKNADYVFPKDNLFIELKTLTKNHGDRESILAHVSEALMKLKLPPSLKDAWLAGDATLPRTVRRIVDRKVTNSVKNAVRKANEQLRASQALVGHNYNGILLVANLQETVFGPVELLRSFAVQALDRTKLSIDAVVMITPGVAYATDGGIPRQYVAPVYRNGMTHLGDFIEPMLNAWIEFEARSLGVQADVEIVREFDRESLNARPVVAMRSARP